jgi:hypothetical protein
MDSSNKENTCRICRWKGRTHIHHIIPRSLNGSEDEENKIELCPNHHAEACIDEEAFALKNNLQGKRKSQEELEAIREFSALNFELGNSDFLHLLPKFIRFQQLKEKYGFDQTDAVSYFMGISRNQAEKYEIVALKDKQIKQEDKGELSQ